MARLGHIIAEAEVQKLLCMLFNLESACRHDEQAEKVTVLGRSVLQPDLIVKQLKADIKV